MSKYISVFYLILMVGLTNVAFANENKFVEGGVGVGFHNIALTNGGEVSSISEFLRFSGGVKLKHTLSLSGSLRIWNTGEEDDNGDAVNHALFHDFHFTGISMGAEAQLFLPSLAQGPYIKGGRHCWVASVREVFNLWNASGCSNLVGTGILIQNSAGNKGSYFAEVILTEFKYVNSWMLVGGVRF